MVYKKKKNSSLEHFLGTSTEMSHNDQENKSLEQIQNHANLLIN